MAELPDLIEGESISYSFQVPGWYMVLGLLLLTLLVIGLLQLRKYLKNAYRLAALKEVEAILAGNAEQWIFRIALLLKQTAMAIYGREQVAALQGEAWYAFLRSSAKPDERFTETDFKDFIACHYSAQVPDGNLAIKMGDFARHWIKTHHAGSI